MADAETRPLLQRSASSGALEQNASTESQQQTRIQTVLRPWHAVIAPLLLSAFLHAMGTNVTEVTMSDLGEDILCRRHFPELGDVPLARGDPRCKSAEVQADLSILQAVEHTFGVVPSVLTSVLYGVASDRFGRKPIMCLSVVGLLALYAVDYTICTHLGRISPRTDVNRFLDRFPSIFDIYWIWPATLLVFIGGGPQVYESMACAMVSDVILEAERANIFFYLVAAALAGNLAGAPLTFYLMQYGPWITSAVGYSCYVARLLVIFFLCQEPRKEKNLRRIDEGGRTMEEPANPGAVFAVFISMRTPILAVKRTYRACVNVFWIHRKLGILLITLLFSDLGRYTNSLFNQYIAKRFDWSWSQANLLSSIKTFSRLTLLVAFMPLASQLLNKAGMQPIIKDAQISRYAMLLAAISTFGIGFASTFYAILPFLLLSTFQSVSRASLNSLLPSLAGPDQTGALYSVMAVLDSLGLMVAAPATAAIFKVGLCWGGAWVGLPYILCGVFMTVSTVILFAVRITREDHFKARGP